MMGLLAMSFSIPAIAADKPAYALNPDAVPGWWMFKEGSLFDWNFSFELNDFQINAWYQIWINNETPKATPADAWLNATAGMVLLVVDFGQDVDNYAIQLIPGVTLRFNLWNLLIPFTSWFNNSAEEKSIPGLTKALVWKSSVTSAWWGVGYSGHYVILALGKGDQTPPGNPFEGGLGVPVKTAGPTASGASQANIMTLMGSQAGAFGGGIPGFAIAPIFLAMAVLFTIVFLLRKDQLHLLK
jgi:hypothetical protein